MRIAFVSLESFYDHSLALDYLAGYMSLLPGLSDSIEFEIFVESEGLPYNNVVSRLVDFRPDIIGFNTYVWNVEATIAAVKALKAIYPTTVIVLGGIEATFNASALLAEVSQLDFVVIGEGEITFSDLLYRLFRGKEFTTPQQGLAWRNGSKMPVIGGMGMALTRLDDIPSPFQKPDYAKRGVRRVLYESYRGCVFQCSYCLYQRNYADQRYFSEDRVKADLDAILRSEATHIRFIDATFNVNRRRAKKILRHMQGCKINVCVEVSAEFFDEEMVSLFPQAGIKHIDIGLQSTQPVPLKAVQREWYRKDRFGENIDLLRMEPSLALNVELIAGLPGDDIDGFRQSLDDTVLMWPDHVSVYRLLGLKGTQMEHDAQQFGLQFSQKPPYELIESTSFSTAELLNTDELAFANMILFNFGIGRYTLRYITEVFELRPSDIYDEFVTLVTAGNIYSPQEIRHLGRYHTYGNRFDTQMPLGLELERVHQATLHFFERTGCGVMSNGEREIALELVDFGYSLAKLDVVQGKTLFPSLGDNGDLRIAPWCRYRSFSPSVIAELERQGNNLGGLSADEIDTVVFFIHPELGPAALGLNKPMAFLIDCVNKGNKDVDGSVITTLRNLSILV